MMTCADHADLSFRKNESKWHQLVDAGDNRLYPIVCNTVRKIVLKLLLYLYFRTKVLKFRHDILIK